MLKKVISGLLAISLCVQVLSSFSISAFAAEIQGDSSGGGHSSDGMHGSSFNYNGHSYAFFDNICNTWDEAKDFCESIGGYLAVINDEKENETLYRMMRSVGLEGAYFGYSDANEEGNWQWIHKDLSTYDNFHKGLNEEDTEPNNGQGYADENYAMFFYKYSNGEWNDGDFGFATEDGVKAFICEWDYEDAKLASDVNIEDSTSDTYNYNSHRYQVVNRPMSWSEARNYCEQLGGYLATITSSEEQVFIKEIIELNNHSDIYWLGATDEKKEGQWEWITGEKFSYENWCVRAPDNFYHEQCGYENYLGILGKDFSWWGDSNKAFKWNDFADTTSDGDNSFCPGLICEWDDEHSAVNTVYELRYKPNSSKTILTAKFDKSNHMYDLDLLAEKWNSHVYCPELAHILSVVASSAYTKESTYDDITGYNMKQLGFTDYKPYNYYDTTDIRYEKDSVAFTIAKKKLSNGDTLVLIPMRGTFGGFDTFLYEQSDWTSNIHIDQLGDEIVNYGFFEAASYVFDNLKDALGGSIPTSGVKYIITGHSRAAGVGNVLAKQMIDSGVPQANLFDYNFACPDVAMEKEAGWNPNNIYSSIFNLCVPGDLISVLPGKMGDGIFSRHQFDKADLEAENKIWRLIGLTRAEPKKWGKYGNSHWFAENWKDIPTENITSAFSAHDHGNYVNVFSKEINIWEAKSYSEMKKQQWYNAFSYLAIFSESSPTRKKPSFSSIKKTSLDGESSELSSEGILGNIDILDKNEVIIASIRNDEITYKENDELIILLWNNEHEKCVSIYGRNDIKYRLVDNDKDKDSINCFLSSYVETNNSTDCYAYYENINVPESSILEMSIDSTSDQQSTMLSVLDSEYSAISTIPASAFISSSMYGDLTGDRDVSVDDAQLTLKAYTERIAGNDMKLTAEQIMAADVNDDGEISVDDAQNILIYYVNNTVAGKLLAWAELFKD